MIPQPFDHQKTTTQFINDNLFTYITSSPGTGKTRSCLDAITQFEGRTLVVAPKSILKASWGNDIEKFTPHLTYAIADAKNRYEAFNSNADVVLINHDGIKWVETNKALLEDFVTLIVDESTAFKNGNAQRSKACLNIADYFDRRILLTGTPNPNGIADVFHQMKILDGGERLGKSFWAFRAATHTPVPKGAFTEWTEKEGATEAVFGLIQDVNIRYKLEDCIDMPENISRFLDFELSPEHLTLYKELKRQAVLTIKDAQVTAVNAAALATKLLQAASGTVYSDHGTLHLTSDRYELIMDLVEEREQCLVAFNWGHQKEALINIARKRNIAYAVIDGSVPADYRATVVEDFQAGKTKVIFAHPASAAHGLTLTAGTTTIWTSPTQNAEHYEQFNNRIYRAGQTKRTETINICALNTLEEKAYKNLMNKRNNMQELLELLEL